MSTKYTFSIQDDFPNQAVALPKFTGEITSSTITRALDYVNTEADVCDVWFKADLESGVRMSLVLGVMLHEHEII